MTIYFKGMFNTWTCVPEGVAYTFMSLTAM